jgi:hypothetical protein
MDCLVGKLTLLTPAGLFIFDPQGCEGHVGIQLQIPTCLGTQSGLVASLHYGVHRLLVCLTC